MLRLIFFVKNQIEFKLTDYIYVHNKQTNWNLKIISSRPNLFSIEKIKSLANYRAQSMRPSIFLTTFHKKLISRLKKSCIEENFLFYFDQTLLD